MTKKFRVGLLTLSLHENYGGILQAYALQKYIKSLGFQTVFINRQPNRLSLSDINKPYPVKLLSFAKRYLNNFDGKHRVVKEATEIESFIEEYISPKTAILDSQKAIKSVISDYGIDAIVVGSDQVWQPKYSGSYTSNLFLDFAQDSSIKRLTYAASFGGNTWSYDEKGTSQLSRLLKNFDAVSVRENSGIDLCNRVFGVNATQLIDPTLLLDRSDYLKLISATKEKIEAEGNYLLTYILDPTEEKNEIINAIAKKHHLQVLSMGCITEEAGRTFYGKLKVRKSYPSIAKWLGSFHSAQYIVTDSFHGVAFSTIFRKQFLAIGNKDRGIDRFKSLLELLGLKNRLIFGAADLTNELIDANIDFSLIESILRKEEDRSKEFLLNILSK